MGRFLWAEKLSIHLQIMSAFVVFAMLYLTNPYLPFFYLFFFLPTYQIILSAVLYTRSYLPVFI
jgi:hypothetical protein